jgi:hypothetical protein
MHEHNADAALCRIVDGSGVQLPDMSSYSRDVLSGITHMFHP